MRRKQEAKTSEMRRRRRERWRSEGREAKERESYEADINRGAIDVYFGVNERECVVGWLVLNGKSRKKARRI